MFSGPLTPHLSLFRRFFVIRQFRYQHRWFVVDTGDQQLVDTVVIDIHHFKLVTGELHRIGAFRILRSMNIIKPPMVS